MLSHLNGWKWGLILVLVVALACLLAGWTWDNAGMLG